MTTRDNKSMTALLRKAIANSGKTLSELERETGVIRQSFMAFLAGKTIRLDSADVLAKHFGIKATAPKVKGRKGRR